MSVSGSVDSHAILVLICRVYQSVYVDLGAVWEHTAKEMMTRLRINHGVTPSAAILESPETESKINKVTESTRGPLIQRSQEALSISRPSDGPTISFSFTCAMENLMLLRLRTKVPSSQSRANHEPSESNCAAVAPRMESSMSLHMLQRSAAAFQTPGGYLTPAETPALTLIIHCVQLQHLHQGEVFG